MKKILIFLLLILFTLPAFPKNTILIVGDSLSSGHGFEVNQGWVKLLENRLEEQAYDWQVVNISSAGATTHNGLTRLPAALKENEPKIVVIELGGNDGLRGLPIVTIRNNLQHMITLAKESHSEVLLIGIRLPPNYGPDYTAQFQKTFVELAEENNISVVPLFLAGMDENANLFQADRIHPTAEAQTILLENVWPNLEALLKK